jgi:excisionase family DNA binding protein
MSRFSNFDLQHASLDDFCTIEESMSKSEIESLVDDLMTMPIELAQGELEEISERALSGDHPKMGYSTSQIFEEPEDYIEFLQAEFEEEQQSMREELISWIEAESDLYANLERITEVDMTNSTMQDNFLPDCPICGASPDTDANGDTEYGCSHFLGTFNGWYDDDEIQHDLAESATHRVIWSTSVAGNPEAYFATSDYDVKMSVSEVAELVGRAPATVRQTILRGALPAEKLGKQWTIRRVHAERLWKKFPVVMLALWISLDIVKVI